MYEVLEISLGDLTRLYKYIRANAFEARFSIKGFDYPWLINSHQWKKGEKILDVGGAYSKIPLHISKKFGGELWVADDFGGEDKFWRRGSSPQAYIHEHPEVKFVFERVGDPKKSSLPNGYFDLIYSLSTLEHVPQEMIKSVWKHMDMLLKPGGEMLHAIDLAFPSNRGLWKVLTGALFDALYGLIPNSLRARFCLSTPKAFARWGFKALSTHVRINHNLSVLNMVLHPDILTESYEFGINRMVKDGMTDYKYQRTATLLIRLKKPT